MGTIYTFNGKVLKNAANDKWLIKKVGLPPIPANTVRVRTSDGLVPTKADVYGITTSYETATLVPGTTDVYDVYKSGTSFDNFLYHSSNVVEVLGANTSNVTSMSSMFSNCTSLNTVAIFDTSNVTNMSNMFTDNTSLTKVPLVDTSSVTNMNGMFSRCFNVESGALDLYNQASTQVNPPANHNGTFNYCGFNTVTGAAELAQIPPSWGGGTGDD